MNVLNRNMAQYKCCESSSSSSSLSVWIPHSGCILCYGSHIRFVGSFFDLSVAFAEVSLDESSGGICFLGSDVNMSVEVEVLVNMDTEIFGRCDFFKVNTMNVGGRADWLAFLGNA